MKMTRVEFSSRIVIYKPYTIFFKQEMKGDRISIFSH